MMLSEIEELIKSVNRNAIKAMLRNAAILSDEKASDDMKAQALDNVKAIVANKHTPKNKSTKIKQPVPAQPVPAQPVPAQPVPLNIEYPQDLHLSPLNGAGHDEKTMRGIFETLPDHEKKSIVDWHSNTKMKKSFDVLHNLFTQLKKHL